MSARARFRPTRRGSDPRAAGIGNESDPGECFLEIGRTRGNDQIAGERDVHRSAHGRPVERSDRDFEIQRVADQRIVVPLEGRAELKALRSLQ